MLVLACVMPIKRKGFTFGLLRKLKTSRNSEALKRGVFYFYFFVCSLSLRFLPIFAGLMKKTCLLSPVGVQEFLRI